MSTLFLARYFFLALLLLAVGCFAYGSMRNG